MLCTYPDERFLDVIIDEVDALPLLSMHEALLGDVQRVGGVPQGLLARAPVLLHTDGGTSG